MAQLPMDPYRHEQVADRYFVSPRDFEILQNALSWKFRAERAEEFKGDVMAGCDIQRGDTLYRQKRVVIGPGKTEDELQIESLEARMHPDDVMRRVDFLAAETADWQQKYYAMRDKVWRLEELLGDLDYRPDS